MYRDNYEKHVPTCPKTVPVVDQYLWKERDTNKYTCTNGVSHPIYDCKGDVSFTLPLEMYPPGGKVHPQIALSNRMHYNYRMSPDFIDISKEGYDADTSAIQYDLLDQGSFDMDAPGFFRQKEGFTQESNQRSIMPTSSDSNLGLRRFGDGDRRRKERLHQIDLCEYGLCDGTNTGLEGYGSASSIQFDLLDQGSFDMDAPGYFGHSTSIARPRRLPRLPITDLQKFLQPWNPDIFSNSQPSESFAQIPTPSANFPLEYQSPLMQPPHTLRTPYGIRPGSECKGLYGF